MANEGRIDSAIAEAVVDLPAADDYGRISSSIAEVVVTAGNPTAQVAYISVNVWSEAVSGVDVVLPRFDGGVVPGLTSSLLRRRRR